VAAAIDHDAEPDGKTGTEFMLDGATTHAAEEVSLDRRVFHLHTAQYEASKQALDSPGRPTAALRKLLAQPAPWER
jgi:uncharacterized protein (DUF1778 family)